MQARSAWCAVQVRPVQRECKRECECAVRSASASVQGECAVRVRSAWCECAVHGASAQCESKHVCEQCERKRERERERERAVRGARCDMRTLSLIHI